MSASPASRPTNELKSAADSAKLHETLEQASYEVDRSLLLWSLSLSPMERLRAATRAARMLGRFHRVESP